MSKDKAKSLSELISANKSGLGRLARQAQQRTHLSDYMRTRLGSPLADGFMHCNINEDGTLIVVAVNPEWASRLRFESQQLIAFCQDFGAEALLVKVRVTGT